MEIQEYEFILNFQNDPRYYKEDYKLKTKTKEQKTSYNFLQPTSYDPEPPAYSPQKTQARMTQSGIFCKQTKYENKPVLLASS